MNFFKDRRPVPVIIPTSKIVTSKKIVSIHLHGSKSGIFPKATLSKWPCFEPGGFIECLEEKGAVGYPNLVILILNLPIRLLSLGKRKNFRKLRGAFFS